MMTIKVQIDDDFRTNTVDVARVWLTHGDKPDDTMSLSVMVRAVSHGHELHTGILAHLCGAIRKAVEDAMQPGPIELLVEKPANEKEGA